MRVACCELRGAGYGLQVTGWGCGVRITIAALLVAGYGLKVGIQRRNFGEKL